MSLAVKAMPKAAPKSVEKRKPGPAPKVISSDEKKMVIRAAALGMPMDRVAGIVGLAGDTAGWARLLDRDPELKAEIEKSRHKGELVLLDRIDSGENGWQGAAWLLERARGYVARASLEHTGKGGSALTIAHQVLTAVGEKEK